MTMRERLPAQPDSVDLSATLELLASLTQYAEAGAIQPAMLAQAAQHALEEHGNRTEILIAVAKLYLAAGERGEASRVIARATGLAADDQRIAQLVSETGAKEESRTRSTEKARSIQPSSGPRPAGGAGPDTRDPRREMASPPPATPRSAASPGKREPTLRSLRELAASRPDESARSTQGDTMAPATPRSAAAPDGPLLRPTVRMARVTQAPERSSRWGKPGEAPDARAERESPAPDGARPRGRPEVATPVPPSTRDTGPLSRGRRAATGNLKLLDPNDERRHLDRYELIGEIASGGMASVFLARIGGVAGFQRFFAIKRLHPHLADEQEFIDMFLDEARLAAGIHHPNVVPILEVGTTEAGYYLVMDYIEGDTLSGVIGRASAMGGLPVPMALRIVLDTLHGLHAAHELTDSEGHPIDLVHRDCSPQNILVGVDGSSRITDFGVARASSRLTTTRSATVKGKLAYLSPEQATGRSLDRRSDLFGMGVILWEVLAGRRLFRADSDGATLSRILVEPIPPLSQFVDDLPESVCAVVARALARDPDDRFATASDLADALEQAVRDSGDPAVSIASPREVSTYIRELFGPDIAARRDAIRAWSAQGSDVAAASGPRSQGFRRAMPSSPEPPSSRRAPSITSRATPGEGDASTSGTEPPSSKTEPSVVHADEVAAVSQRASVPLVIEARSAADAPKPDAAPSSSPAAAAPADPTLPAASSPLTPSVRPAALATTPKAASKRPSPALIALTLLLVALALAAYVLRSR